ncbi:phosphate ABC transporter permease PstA [Yinghuangia seranimata]|uniref:phosphate ABC transporter permease PstA n=1 Tax=Yinghuangia seranimata TaxID=408067 RepID=UPI00248BF0B0|nr:phosphate ABC transporter permease PstA [Yinghuangia seranimata]MDI2132869.1 phosphate ABC transporter permease PstA [Yinghuangia seranimata]
MNVIAPPAAPPPAVAAPAPTPAPQERRVALRGVPREELGVAAAALLAGAAFAWVLYGRILPTSGWQGYLITAYVSFLALYGFSIQLRRNAVEARDRVATAVITTGIAALLGTVGTVIVYIFVRGSGSLDADFFTETQEYFGALSGPDVAVGAAHAIVGTLEQVALATLMTVPLGVATAVYLNEVRGRLAQVVRVVVEAMSALPSVVAGLFVFAVVIVGFGQNRSGFAASLALGIMMLPIVTRTTEVVLRLVPGGLREASLALGASELRTLWHVVLPTARSGLGTAVILGVARAVGETSPVLLVAGGSTRMNWNPFEGEQESLVYFIWRNIKSPSDRLNSLAFGGAVALVGIVLSLFVLTRLLARAPGELSRRQKRRIAREAAAAGPSRPSPS